MPEFRPLGRTGVKVTNPCLGTMTFGWEPDDWGSTESESIKVADTAVELGLNFFDTADVYGRGSSETILGQWMKSKKNRDDLVIATKFHGRMHDSDPNQMGNSRRHIIQACEASLKRLQTDYIDLYQVHRPQVDLPIEETMRALDDLVRAGKVRYIGASTFPAWQVAEANYIAKSMNCAQFVSEQPPYNIFDRRIENELLPYCQRYSLAVLPWSPLAGGQLSGKYLDDQPKGARYSQSDPMNRINRFTTSKAKKLRDLAKRNGLSLVELSLAWVAGNPAVTAPIIGAKNPRQLKDSVAACQIKLPQKVLDGVDRILAPGSHMIDYYKLPTEPGVRPFV